ncbi:MAG: hypothetical protein ACP5NV_06685 [Candidatus Woesearchaeota archaeon]
MSLDKTVNAIEIQNIIKIENGRTAKFDSKEVIKYLKNNILKDKKIPSDIEYIKTVEELYGFKSRKIELKGDGFIVYGITENENSVQLEFEKYRKHGTIRKLGESFAHLIKNRWNENHTEYKITQEAVNKAELALKTFQKYDIHLVQK